MCGGMQGNQSFGGQRMSQPFSAGQQQPGFQAFGPQMSSPFSVNQQPPQMNQDQNLAPGQGGGQMTPDNVQRLPGMGGPVGSNLALMPNTFPFQMPQQPGMQPGPNFSYNGPNGLMYAESYNGGMKRPVGR